MISIVVCYRNREEHLTKFVPHIRNHFKDQEHEIIIVEQADNDRFRRGNLLNEGARIAKGDIIALHDVDYLPTPGTEYWKNGVDVFRPANKVNFVMMDGNPRNEEDIPSGYRHFKDGIDDDFYGAVTVFSKSAFKLINGFNALYEGWGLEDADLRQRITAKNLRAGRGDGVFLALPHKDSFPGHTDEGFVRNQQIFARWQEFSDLGMTTCFPTVNTNPAKEKFHDVDVWLEVTNFSSVTKELVPYMNLENITDFYEDDPDMHTRIWNNFKMLVNSTPNLKEHRDWVVQNRWGYGNRAFHWMWNILIKEAPRDFKFLEIGVFKGQIVNLVSLLSKAHQKNGSIFGVTPLTNVGDKYGGHPDINYEDAIAQIYAHFGLDGSDLTIIQGLSNDESIIQIAEENGPYNFVFIDGCHDYEVVVSDLKKYGDMLAVGGYLIVDDSSNHLKIPNGLIRLDWRGLPEVTKAVQDVIDTDDRFVHKFAVGHNRVFQRIK